MGFLRVKIIEPHSSMCVALTENSEEILFGYYIFLKSLIDINFDPEKDYICFPDEGAQKRYSDIFSDYKQCVGYKKRNFKTGRIEKLDILGVDVGDTNFNAVIVDDLCSYGGTFMLSAGKLKDVGANNISLIVTHCEESILKGDIPKSEIIKDVYTTDSIIIKTEDIPEKIRILSLESLLGYNK
jgi:ribose-phosphate pyrophosphokinase